MTNFFNQSRATKKKVVSIILCGVFFIEGIMFYNHHSYAYHVAQAEDNLNELMQLLEGGVSNNALGASLLGTFIVKDDFLELRLKNTTKRIVGSLERAIENADDLTEVPKLKEAFTNIATIQTQGMNLLHGVIEKVESKTISNEIEITYKKALDLQEKVNDANHEIETAIKQNQKILKIDVITSKDSHHGDNHDDENEDFLKKEIKVVDNATGREKKLQDDAIQREINREKIMMIEETKAAHKSQQLEQKMKQSQAKRNTRERILTQENHT